MYTGWCRKESTESQWPAIHPWCVLLCGHIPMKMQSNHFLATHTFAPSDAGCWWDWVGFRWSSVRSQPARVGVGDNAALLCKNELQPQTGGAMVLSSQHINCYCTLLPSLQSWYLGKNISPTHLHLISPFRSLLCLLFPAVVRHRPPLHFFSFVPLVASDHVVLLKCQPTQNILQKVDTCGIRHPLRIVTATAACWGGRTVRIFLPFLWWWWLSWELLVHC